MAQDLKIIVSASENSQRVQLSGHINEASNLSSVLVNPDVPLDIDLAGLKGMNSSGLREFRKWTQSLENKTIAFSYCPKIFIDQINMVKTLIPKWAKVTSFYVPYYSDESDEEKSVLFTVDLEIKRVGGDLKIEYPTVLDSDGEQMLPDVILAKYFEFLKLHT